MLNFIKSILFSDMRREHRYHTIFIDKTGYYRASRNDFSLDRVIVCCEYDQKMQKDLINYKYRYNRESLGDFVALLEKGFAVYGKHHADAIITGIPMHLLRRILRAYNHSYLLARRLGERLGTPFADILRKKRPTKQQSKLTKEERGVNVSGSFLLNPRSGVKLQGKTVILIDDVISTGSTADEAGKVLKQNGAKEVIGLFLATGKTNVGKTTHPVSEHP